MNTLFHSCLVRSLSILSLARRSCCQPRLLSPLRSLLRGLVTLHTACVCQRRGGKVLCGLAATGFISLS